MRVPHALVAFAALAFVLPVTAEARGGGGGGGARGGGGGGRAAAPAARSSGPSVRSASPRASAPSRSFSPSPRSSSASPRSFGSSGRASSPSPRSYRPAPRASAPPSRSYGATSRATAPSYRSTASSPRRSSAPAVRSTGGSNRGQPVLRSGQVSAPGAGRSTAAASRSGSPAVRSTGARRSTALGAGASAPAARSTSGGRTGVLGTGDSGFRRSSGDGLLGDASRRLQGRDRTGSSGGGGRDGGGAGTKGGSGHHSGHHDGGHHDDGHHDGDCHYDDHHSWYDHGHWGLTFSFGVGYGAYYGVPYYYPYHSYVYGCDYAFFYPAPVTYAYVPYGFYAESEPVYVTRYEVIRETVPQEVYEMSEGPPAPAPEGAEVRVADPAPAAGSPATEKFLREASAHFRKKEYYEAAVQFRLAALSSPDLPGPLFALGQSLVAMEQDAYAAKVLRKAIEMSPKMLEETGDISGVWESPQEFDRVMKALEARAAESPVDGDARFLLATERYFAGDVRCREALDLLQKARPMDAAVAHLRVGAAARFKNPDELPAIEKK